ncbi:uncharacterized protein LOC135153231 [Lytechinus pictus]|uniref:uncharacterized protein LOC135153231 n=1 Tax=Lytechinus pictus TaxID=7653 RepID=UPI0030B9E906
MHKTQWKEFLEESTCEDNIVPTAVNVSASQTEEKEKDSDSDWSEIDEKEPVGSLDTMLYPQNVDDQQNILSFAPSEGNIPISSLQADIEELSFPTIFCGERRPSNKDREIPLKYSDICKLELRHSDRRAAKSVTNIFFKCKKLQMKQIKDKIWLSLRRVKTSGKSYTAGDVKQQDVVDSMVKLDEGYRIFRTLRGSPPYWETAKKDLFAMIRQLGLPTWFISLSSAESHWTDLLISLGKLVDNKQYSAEDVSSFTWETKNRLIRSDPVTVTRYFDHRVKKFYQNFLQGSCEPLGKISEHFYRIEFQHRGSAHLHSLLWVNGAPKFEIDSNSDIENYIDNFIETDGQSLGVNENLKKLQCHRHTHTCRKKGKVCRFNFPLPPMESTKILQPLPVEMEDKEKQLHKQKWKEIQIELNKPEIQQLTLQLFLDHFGISPDDYELAIRSSISASKVFLKREPCNVRVNAYNPAVLQAWQANTDIQFITNAYACAMYVVNYVSKGQRGMSELLRRTCDEARKGSTDIKDQVRLIGNKFLKHVEISAPEAIYLSLQMPLKHSSCGHAFVNTSPPDQRPFILKPSEQLDALPADSEDIQCSNNIKRYSERPRKARDMCLADFIAWYDMKKVQFKKKRKVHELELPETDSDDNKEDEPDDSDLYQNKQTCLGELKISNTVIMKRRKKQKVIRYVRYDKEKDPENYYRENLMLFYPYISESEIIGNCQTYEERYQMVKQVIEEKQKEYNQYAEELDMAEQKLLNDSNEENLHNVAPCNEHINEINANKFGKDRNAIEGEDLFTSYDIASELGIQSTGTDMQEERIRNRLSDSKFREIVSSLNQKQSEFFNHVLNKVKTSDEQLLLFLSGGAGVGKTRVIKSLYQALVRHYNTESGSNPDVIKVLLTAPTGKAAYLIRGQTLHSAFCIPANQGFSYKPLSHDKRNTLRTQLGELKLVFIDEISMVGTKMFCFINQRLQEVMNVSKPFGGVSIIAIGDLFQLQPVMDTWIFKNPTTTSSTEVLAPNVWTNNFELFELTDIMRQKEDVAYAALLNRMREGKQTKEDIKLLKGRIISKEDENYPVDVTHLLYHNEAVDAHNKQLHSSVANQAVLASHDIVIGDITDEVKQKVLSCAKAKEMGLSKTCNLALELKAELTVNIDTADGLVNGAACVSKYFQYDKSGNVEIVWPAGVIAMIQVQSRPELRQANGMAWHARGHAGIIELHAGIV